MSKIKKLKIYFVIVFLILLTLTTIILNSIKNNNIDIHLKQESDIFHQNYKVIYNDYKNIANLIFNTYVKDDKIINLFALRNREGLKNYLDDKYNKLRVFNLRQLHFHLPNNDSFLRMHRPNKFGDNLTKDRKTVSFVNKYKKSIDGFEEGKIFNGFRFVYPLFLSDKHIGSVEISFSALFFIQQISKSYNVITNFLIKKSVVDQKVFKEEKSNYISSPLKDYYYQKSVYDKLSLEKKNYKIGEKLNSEILEKMKLSKSFSIYIDQFKEIVIFIPLINPITKQNVAFLKINKTDTKIDDIRSEFISYLTLITLLILMILLFLYSQFSYQTKLEKIVKEKTENLNNLNKNLKETIEKEVAENRKKDELIIAQSRNAAMGEMISMIAHQWRQPLTSISMNVNNILADIELEMINENELKNVSYDVLEKTQYLSKTIDDFRSYFKPEKSFEKIEIKDTVAEALKIMNNNLSESNINIKINCSVTKPIETYSRELLQVFINIIKNAKEALDNIVEKERQIEITCKENNQFLEISFFDNAENINEDIINKIFDPYFSTKDKNVGTGLGLYMSKIIIEKHLGGKIAVSNIDKGVVFIITLPLKFKE